MAATKGVVAAGHPLTAEAGATVLRDGGNAVDAAIAAVLTSCVTESPLTGLGAGGYMLVHDGSEQVLLDFFVEAPGRDGREHSSELVPIPIHFTDENVQVFHVGAASCGVPGTPAGLVAAAERFGSVPLAELARPAAALARDGFELNPEQAYFFEILAPILTLYEEAAAIYAPEGRILGAGETVPLPASSATPSSGWAPRAQSRSTGATSPPRCRSGSWSGAGRSGRDDLAAYEPVERQPVRASYGGREMLTNPPPASGGILIAYALAVLERLDADDVEALVGAMEAAQAARGEEFLEGLLTRRVRGAVPRGGGARRRGRARALARRRRRGADPAGATSSARRRTSPRSTTTGAARASPARTGPGRA